VTALAVIWTVWRMKMIRWNFFLLFLIWTKGLWRDFSAECPDSPSARKEELARRGRGRRQTTAMMMKYHHDSEHGLPHNETASC